MNAKYHGPDAEQFNGKRWVGTGKQAVMVNNTYFPFGLGRWACPGRALAVAGELPSSFMLGVSSYPTQP